MWPIFAEPIKFRKVVGSGYTRRQHHQQDMFKRVCVCLNRQPDKLSKHAHVGLSPVMAGLKLKLLFVVYFRRFKAASDEHGCVCVCVWMSCVFLRD